MIANCQTTMSGNAGITVVVTSVTTRPAGVAPILATPPPSPIPQGPNNTVLANIANQTVNPANILSSISKNIIKKINLILVKLQIFEKFKLITASVLEIYINQLN